MYDEHIAKREAAISGPRQMTVKEVTQSQLQQAEAEVERCKELLRLLDANPETQRILELLRNRL